MRKKCLALLALLALGGAATAQNNPVEKTNEFRIAFKTGRTFFTNPVELGGLSTHVFYGQLGLDYGVCRGEKFYYGAGIGAEFIDMMDAGLSCPIHLELRYYFTGNHQEGAYVDVQAGYVFGGQQSFPIVITQLGEIPVGQITRKSSGPFGEVSVGYRTNRFDFFVAYDYRVTHYLKTFQYHDPSYDLEDVTYFKPLHTVMAGVSYKVF